jgi:cellobiose phosphorylase
VIGWAWAEVTSLIVHHVAGVRPGLDALTIRPRLPEGVDRLTASFRIRGAACDLSVRRTHLAPSARVDGRSATVAKGALLIPYRDLKPGGMPGGTQGIKIEMEVS